MYSFSFVFSILDRLDVDVEDVMDEVCSSFFFLRFDRRGPGGVLVRETKKIKFNEPFKSRNTMKHC